MENDERCAITGGPAERGHHLTGRGPDGEQLDEELTAPVGHDGHELVHEDLRREGLDKPLEADTVPERMERRLRRVGLFMGRVAEAVPPLAWLMALARSCARWADELAGFVRALDSWNPGWRLI